ncbi:hypothetical protein [Olivibacter sp. XZL3]|uniref:hypothetical protein n=1 Tax=Olivibacter sp. XZL3 TaxID=1735116 RepID=UPI0010667B55|nr:hypothetical protein [Olivibacter sp. XZL3]
MELKVFDHEAWRSWKEKGYSNVKLTNSDNIGLGDKLQQDFVLVEPYQDTTEAYKYGVLAINSTELENIIQEGRGRYYSDNSPD